MSTANLKSGIKLTEKKTHAHVNIFMYTYACARSQDYTQALHVLEDDSVTAVRSTIESLSCTCVHDSTCMSVSVIVSCTCVSHYHPTNVHAPRRK